MLACRNVTLTEKNHTRSHYKSPNAQGNQPAELHRTANTRPFLDQVNTRGFRTETDNPGLFQVHRQHLCRNISTDLGATSQTLAQGHTSNTTTSKSSTIWFATIIQVKMNKAVGSDEISNKHCMSQKTLLEAQRTL
jgi:hypothetical protein